MVSTDSTGRTRVAARVRACWLSASIRCSRKAISASNAPSACETARNGVDGGTSSSGIPCAAQASTSDDGTVGNSGSTPNPIAETPDATSPAT